MRGALRRLPTVLRSLRHLRADQTAAQLRHLLVGPPAPRRASGPSPTLAIPQAASDFLPAPSHVRTRADGSLELLARSWQPHPPVDWGFDEHGPLFAYHVHQHEYLRTPAWSPDARAEWLVDWIERHPAGVGWDPHPISLRLLVWGKLLLTPGVLPGQTVLRERLLASFADQAETLDHGLEIRLQANHLLSNLAAVVWAGLLLDGTASARWRARAERLAAEIDAQVHPDGGHEERSPMYHALLLETLLDLLNLCRAAPARAPRGLVETLEGAAVRMLGALDLWTHPDGRIALFADSGFDVAAEPAALHDYARRLALPAPASTASGGSRHLPQTGYLRLVAGDFDLIASVAGPAPAHQPGHAHCDALAFELSWEGFRLITDTGNYEYRPGMRRDLARSTASHATLQIDGEEQAELWAAHRIGGRPEVLLRAWDGSGSAEAACRGWSRPATWHRRAFEVGPEGVTIVDRVEGPVESIRASLPFAPEWQVERLAPDRARAVRVADGSRGPRVAIELPGVLEWSLERAPCFPGFGRVEERFVLVGRGRRCPEAITRLRREA